MWNSIFFKSPFIFKKGDVITKKIPINKYSIIYTITGINKDGYLDVKPNKDFENQMQSKTVILSKIDSKILLTENWYFFENK